MDARSRRRIRRMQEKLAAKFTWLRDPKHEPTIDQLRALKAYLGSPRWKTRMNHSGLGSDYLDHLQKVIEEMEQDESVSASDALLKASTAEEA